MEQISFEFLCPFINLTKFNLSQALLNNLFLKINIQRNLNIFQAVSGHDATLGILYERFIRLQFISACNLEKFFNP